MERKKNYCYIKVVFMCKNHIYKEWESCDYYSPRYEMVYPKTDCLYHTLLGYCESADAHEHADTCR